MPLEYVPALHGWQVDAVPSEKEPESQSLQLAPDLYVPAGQGGGGRGSTHGLLPPVATALHVTAPALEVVPVGHAAHAVTAEEPRAGLAEPAAQGTGVAEPAGQ